MSRLSLNAGEGGFFDLKLPSSLLRNATSLWEGGLPGPKQGKDPSERGLSAQQTEGVKEKSAVESFGE